MYQIKSVCFSVLLCGSHRVQALSPLPVALSLFSFHSHRPSPYWALQAVLYSWSQGTGFVHLHPECVDPARRTLLESVIGWKHCCPSRLCLPPEDRRSPGGTPSCPQLSERVVRPSQRALQDDGPEVGGWQETLARVLALVAYTTTCSSCVVTPLLMRPKRDARPQGLSKMPLPPPAP